MEKWNKDQLMASLQQRQTQGLLKQWRVQWDTLERQEFYLIQGATEKVELDQSRRVEETTFRVHLWVAKEQGRLGRASEKLFTNQNLEPQLERMQKSAELSSEETWDLPQQFSKMPSTCETLYPGLRDDFTGCALKVKSDLEQAVVEQQAGDFNSAELFVGKHCDRTFLSNGFVGEKEYSRFYAEVCFSVTNSQAESEEFLVTKCAGHPEQLEFVELCRQSVEGAQNSLKVHKPKSGTYSVLVSSEVLAQIFADVAVQMNSSQKYFAMPFIEKGGEFISNYTGEPFSWTLDPQLDFAFASHQYNSEGLAQARLPLVKDNRVLENLTSGRVAQYLKSSPTTCIGNNVIEATGAPVEELRRSAPQVLEVLQFSGLFGNPQSLTYSSEIRLARLYDNEKGTVEYIKGGNLSGNFKENFSQVRWSTEQSFENLWDSFMGQAQTYKGPKYALLTGVAVSS